MPGAQSFHIDQMIWGDNSVLCIYWRATPLGGRWLTTRGSLTPAWKNHCARNPQKPHWVVHRCCWLIPNKDCWEPVQSPLLPGAVVLLCLGPSTSSELGDCALWPKFTSLNTPKVGKWLAQNIVTISVPFLSLRTHVYAMIWHILILEELISTQMYYFN